MNNLPYSVHTIVVKDPFKRKTVVDPLIPGLLWNFGKNGLHDLDYDIDATNPAVFMARVSFGNYVSWMGTGNMADCECPPNDHHDPESGFMTITVVNPSPATSKDWQCTRTRCSKRRLGGSDSLYSVEPKIGEDGMLCVDVSFPGTLNRSAKLKSCIQETKIYDKDHVILLHYTMLKKVIKGVMVCDSFSMGPERIPDYVRTTLNDLVFHL